jgi:hypothetical protein
MGQPEPRLGSTASQHQGRSNLIRRELVGLFHPRQVVVGDHATYPDLRHRGHHPSLFVIRLPVLGLEDFHAIETGQPRQL